MSEFYDDNLYEGEEESIEDGLHSNPQLQEEYESTFTNEEKVQHALKDINKHSFTLDVGIVDFNTILVSEPVKNGRKETYSGLTTSVAEMGILSPIHVMVLEGYSNWLENHEDGEKYEGPMYSILDGFRRVWAGYKNGITRSYAVIWNFEDKDKGVELSNILSLILNKAQRRSWNEIWYMYQLLEEQAQMTPGTLEYLLQLDPGDAMKLKDIMLCDYPEVIEDLTSNKKTLQQCYNTLQKLRKEEDKLLKDDNTGIANMEQADGTIEKGGDQVLSNEEVNEILEMGDSFNGDLSESDFDENLGMDTDDYERQKVGERHRLDPALKAETMMRDNYTCQCCGTGAEMSMMSRMAILQSHHKISVSNSGPDAPDNITTICQCCHTLVHVLLKNKLKFGMSKEEFDKMSESSKNQHKKIMALARIDWEAGKRLGKNSDTISKENSNYMQFKMPGTDLAENREAYKTLSK